MVLLQTSHALLQSLVIGLPTPTADGNLDSNIGGARSATYTPGTGDVGMCVRATAMYKDGYQVDVTDY